MKNKKYLILMAAAVLAVFSFVVWRVSGDRGFVVDRALEPIPVSGFATVSIDFGNGSDPVVADAMLKNNATVFTATRDVAEEEKMPFVFDPPGDWGVFVRQIGFKKNGDSKQYWQYWVNGIQPQVAADRYVLKPNDRVEWRFVPAQ